MDFQKFLKFLLLEEKNEKLIGILKEVLDDFQFDKQILFSNQKNMQMWIVIMSQILKQNTNISILKQMEKIFKDIQLDEQCSFLFQSYYLDKMNYLYKKNEEIEFLETLDLFKYTQIFSFQNLPGIFSFLMKIINNEFFKNKNFLLKSSTIIKYFLDQFIDQNKDIIVSINDFFKQFRFCFEDNEIISEGFIYENQLKSLQQQILLLQNLKQNIIKININSKKVVLAYLKLFQHFQTKIRNLLENWFALHQNICSLQHEYIRLLFSYNDFQFEKECIDKYYKNLDMYQQLFCKNQISIYVDQWMKNEITLQDLKTLNFLLKMNYGRIDIECRQQDNLFKNMKLVLCSNFKEEFNIIEETIYFSQFQLLTVDKLLQYQKNIQQKFFKDYLIFSQKFHDQPELIIQLFTSLIYQSPQYFMEKTNDVLMDIFEESNQRCIIEDIYFILLINFIVTYKEFKALSEYTYHQNANFKVLQQFQITLNNQKYLSKNKSLYRLIQQMIIVIQANLIRNYSIFDNSQQQFVYRIIGSLDRNLNLSRTFLYGFIQYLISEFRNKRKKLKSKKYDIVKEIFQNNFDDFIYKLTLSLPAKTDFVLKFLCNYINLALKNNIKFFTKEQIFIFYDFLIKFQENGIIKTTELFRDYIYFIQKTFQFFSTNFIQYNKLFDYYLKQEDSKNIPTNFIRRIILQIFYSSQRYYNDNISIISEIISTFNQSFDLLYDRPALKESSDQMLSENVDDNVETANTFSSVLYELRNKLELFMTLYPQWIIKSSKELNDFYLSKKGYNHELKCIQNLKDKCLKKFNDKSTDIILKYLNNYKHQFTIDIWQNFNLYQQEAPYFRIFYETIDLLTVCYNNDNTILNCLNNQLEFLPTYFLIITIFDQNSFHQQKQPLYKALVELMSKNEKHQENLKNILNSEYYLERNFNYYQIIYIIQFENLQHQLSTQKKSICIGIQFFFVRQTNKV